MTEQLSMIWPDARMSHWPEWQVPTGYLLRHFRKGDEEAYLELMHIAGFNDWNRDNLNAVLKSAVPNGIVFVEHVATAKIVATAMGWHKQSPLFPDGYEMGWVAADSTHKGKGLGQIVTNAATRALLEHGARRIYLLTDDWRLPAIKTYLKVGYVPLYHKPGMKRYWHKLFITLGLNMQEYVGVDIDFEEDNQERRSANNGIDSDYE